MALCKGYKRKRNREPNAGAERFAHRTPTPKLLFAWLLAKSAGRNSGVPLENGCKVGSALETNLPANIRAGKRSIAKEAAGLHYAPVIDVFRQRAIVVGGKYLANVAAGQV